MQSPEFILNVGELVLPLVSGSYWLIHIGTVTVLLWNAVALEFIPNVGELVLLPVSGSYWLIHTGTVTELFWMQSLLSSS